MVILGISFNMFENFHPSASQLFIQVVYRQWRNLDGEQQKYLIQISPPADIIPEVIRSIIIAQNITDAGILFDDSFGIFSSFIINIFVLLLSNESYCYLNFSYGS